MGKRIKLDIEKGTRVNIWLTPETSKLLAPKIKDPEFSLSGYVRDLIKRDQSDICIHSVEERIGTTTFECCNICGKRINEF